MFVDNPIAKPIVKTVKFIIGIVTTIIKLVKQIVEMDTHIIN